MYPGNLTFVLLFNENAYFWMRKTMIKWSQHKMYKILFNNNSNPLRVISVVETMI